jgi:hypothetical protein
MLTRVSQGNTITTWAANWQTNNGNNVGIGASLVPVAGNTYTAFSNGVAIGGSGGSTANTRIRPPTSGTATFPGDSLTLLTNTDIRWKTGASGNAMNFPGVGGNPGLILKGGLLNGGDDGTFVITGLIRVDSRSYISQGANGGGGGISVNRAVNFTGQLTGTGDLVIMNAGTTIPQLVSASNTFSGQWILQCGWLVSTTNSALGTNNIIVDPNYVGYLADMASSGNVANSPAGPALFEPRATVNSAGTLTLTNGGRIFLHQEVCFTAVSIHDVPLNLVSNLSAGIHYYPELRANFPDVFDANGSGAVVVQPFGTPPVLPPSILSVQAPTVYTNGTARFVATASDNGFPPLTYQWRTNGVPLVNGRFFGATNSILVISNASAAETGVNYDLVVANASSSVTSSVVALTLVNTNGEAYQAAALAAKPIAFYQLNETTDPSTSSSLAPVSAYDLYGGYIGVYSSGVLNGFSGITGPLPADGFPGFDGGNLAAQTTLNVVNNRISTLAWNLNTNTVTITAWVNPSGAQNPNEGLVFCRSASTVAGLCYASAAGGASLGYNWNNEPDTFNWNSGLAPQPGVWSLVALVVTPTDATIYVLNTNATTVSGAISASRHVYNHAVQAFDVGALIGDDSAGTGGNRSFNGKIDDVAVFNRALSANDLLTLYSAGSGIPTFGPNITIQPVSLSLFQGQTAEFTGLAVGSSPLTYQWQSGPGGGPYVNVSGGKFSGATTPMLTIANADFAEQAVYVVVASNGSGSTTSSEAGLTINATNAFAINVTMSLQEPAGNDWDIGAVTPGGNTNWSDFNPASYSAAQSPGNTYELLPGARLRSPDGPVITTFPGRLLTLDGDSVWRVSPAATDPTSEIRFKQHTYGAVNGVVNIPRLVMNGGQLDVGNDGGPLILNGRMDILANTPINNDAATDRGYVINSFLTGGGGIEYHGYNNTFQTNFVTGLNIAGTSNTFSGTWNVVAGILLGTAPGALGTNHIFVGTNAAIETTYDVVNTNAYLVMTGGRMYLHQTNRFRAAVINGFSVPVGTNTFAQLSASAQYGTNFPAVWRAQFGSTFSNASGMIVVLSNASPIITSQPRSITNRGQQTATFSVAAAGANPLRYQWMAGAVGSGTYTNLIAAPNVSGTVTNTTLTITNVAAANAGDYVVVVTNQFGSVTSLVARLTVLDAPFITLQPLSQTNSGTLTANFFVSALGDLPLSYQWKAAAIGSGGPYTNVNFGPKVTGANSTNLTVSLLAISNSADYIVVVTNLYGSATSSAATLTVIDPLLTQDTTPAGTSTLVQGDIMTWTVAVLGTPPLNSQWQGGVSGSGIFTNMINGPRISGATSTSLTINPVDFPDAGDYRYIVSNVGGSVTSSVVSLTVNASLAAQAYTLDFDQGGGLGVSPIQQAAGLDWNTANNWNPDGEPASTSAFARPGSTYTVVPGARLRSPVGATNSIYPGDFYTPITVYLNGNGVLVNNPDATYPTNSPGMGEIRFKHFVNAATNAGSLASVFFKKLVLNGGQLDQGDNTTNGFALRGELNVATNSVIYVDTAAGQARCFRIESWLTGTGNIEWHDFDSTFSLYGGLSITGSSNTFSGTWHAVTGVLIGSGANSLGTNSITVDGGAALETTYNLNTPTANLTLNGQMFLHSADTVRTLTLGNYQVPAGTYTYAQLAASFPGNFPATWPRQRDSSVSSASGSITVLTGPAINAISNSVTVVGANLVMSGTGGLANGKYYLLSSPNVAIPKASWAKFGPYPFDGAGTYSLSVPITNNPPQQYFMLQQIVP